MTAMHNQAGAPGKLYIIEHMEADENTPESLPPWVKLEYAHMLERTCLPSVSQSEQPNKVYFTNLSQRSASALTQQLQRKDNTANNQSAFEATATSVEQLINSKALPPKNRICLLDPKAQHAISPQDADEFDGFLFGGILGNDPPRDRTKELRKLGFPGRHLGPVQMTTDTAVYVTSIVVDQQIPLDQIPFIDHPTITFNKQESVEMPFRYVKYAEDGQPIMPEGMRELLYADMNKGFEEL